MAAELFAEHGYRGTTVRGIADTAGVLSGSLYHHFDSKETMLDELISQYLEDLSAEYRRIVAEGLDPMTTFERLLRAATASLASHRAAVIVLHNERDELARRARFGYLKHKDAEIRQLWLGVIAEGVTSGAFRPDVDPHLLYQVVCDVISVAVRWFHPGVGLSADQLAEQYLGILQGIANPVHPERDVR